MRARLHKPKPTIGVECSRCLRRRYYHSIDEFQFCECGATTGTIFMGRIEWKDDGHADERVAAYRASVRRRQVETSRHGAGRRIRFVFRKRRSMAKFKIVKRDAAAAKTAQAGSTKTGAKVVKTKAGSPRGATSQPGRFIGKTSGLSVTKFQNKSLEDNRKKRLTDEELVRLWKSEFPNAKSDYTVEIVRGVRSAYNRGKHGNDQPANPVPQFDDNRQPMPFRGARAAAAREAKAERGSDKKSGKKAARAQEEAPVKKLKRVAK